MHTIRSRDIDDAERQRIERKKPKQRRQVISNMQLTVKHPKGLLFSQKRQKHGSNKVHPLTIAHIAIIETVRPQQPPQRRLASFRKPRIVLLQSHSIQLVIPQRRVLKHVMLWKRPVNIPLDDIPRGIRTGLDLGALFHQPRILSLRLGHDGIHARHQRPGLLTQIVRNALARKALDEFVLGDPSHLESHGDVRLGRAVIPPGGRTRGRFGGAPDLGDVVLKRVFEDESEFVDADGDVVGGVGGVFVVARGGGMGVDFESVGGLDGGRVVVRAAREDLVFADGAAAVLAVEEGEFLLGLVHHAGDAAFFGVGSAAVGGGGGVVLGWFHLEGGCHLDIVAIGLGGVFDIDGIHVLSSTGSIDGIMRFLLAGALVAAAAVAAADAIVIVTAPAAAAAAAAASAAGAMEIQILRSKRGREGEGLVK